MEKICIKSNVSKQEKKYKTLREIVVPSGRVWTRDFRVVTPV